MKQAFIDWNPSSKSKVLLTVIQEVLNTYSEEGYTLTLRQLYYQLVSRVVIPNKVKEYKKLVNIVSNARLGGFIDWDMIEDRSRSTESNSHWLSTSHLVRSAANQYYKDRWVEQDRYIEVWIEKDALSGIVEPVCSQHDVTFMANKGYSSQSAMYEAYQRLDNAGVDGKECEIIYLGDHDPSGIDMVRDIENRMITFGLCDFKIDRVALNMDQIELYNPPENPAKSTDPRFEEYAAEHGSSSWELDALEPSVLSKIVGDAIDERVDWEKYQAVVDEETEEKAQLLTLVDKLLE